LPAYVDPLFQGHVPDGATGVPPLAEPLSLSRCWVEAVCAPGVSRILDRPAPRLGLALHRHALPRHGSTRLGWRGDQRIHRMTDKVNLSVIR
jgi:hypothetical protein